MPFSTRYKFNSRCVAVHGRCGSPCGFETHTKDKYCNYGVAGLEGTIPEKYLISDQDYSASKVVYSEQYQDGALFGDILHTFFMIFMTITVISMWISFLPGVGKEDKSKRCCGCTADENRR